MENHGTVYATRFKRMRESIEAMKEIWTKSEAEYHGEFVHFDPMIARPKPVQKPHPPIHVGCGFPMARGAPSALAMAGFQRPAATSPRCCRNFGRWRVRPAAIRNLPKSPRLASA